MPIYCFFNDKIFSDYINNICILKTIHKLREKCKGWPKIQSPWNKHHHHYRGCPLFYLLTFTYNLCYSEICKITIDIFLAHFFLFLGIEKQYSEGHFQVPRIGAEWFWIMPLSAPVMENVAWLVYFLAAHFVRKLKMPWIAQNFLLGFFFFFQFNLEKNMTILF